MEFAESASWNYSLSPRNAHGLESWGSAGAATPLTASLVGQSVGLLRTSTATPLHLVTPLNLVFVDRQVQGASDLAAQALFSLGNNTKVYFLDPWKDAIAQMTQTLFGQGQAIASVHVLSHGAAGQIFLGQQRLGQDNLAAYQSQFQAWSQVLTEDADLVWYGCEVGQDQAFVQRLSQLTQADVAASSNVTGQGGDWILEVQTGAIAQSI
ncbi:MAG: DUF4347 domain-containing protein, partial [Synechococcales bacterium]|nr:DUF4347 domain-containing protein [Synechococcales bacterium]